MKPIDWHGLFRPEMHPSAYLEPDGKVTFLFRKEEGASLH
jgi:hypothetical protein